MFHRSVASSDGLLSHVVKPDACNVIHRHLKTTNGLRPVLQKQLS